MNLFIFGLVVLLDQRWLGLYVLAVGRLVLGVSSWGVYENCVLRSGYVGVVR